MFYAVLLLEQDKFYWGLQTVILPYDKKISALPLIPLRQNTRILACKNFPWHSSFLSLGIQNFTHKKAPKKAPNKLIQVAIYLY